MTQPILLEGNNGELNRLLYYHHMGQVVICEIPVDDDNDEEAFILPQESSAELVYRAQQFAISVISNPVLKTIYDMKAGTGSNAYIVAFTEYLGQE